MGNREHRWRCAWSLVTLEGGARPVNGVAHSDARWLRVRPKLEVLRTIVVPDAVSMVNCFTIEQIPAKQVLCHEYVLEHIRPTCGSRMIRRRAPSHTRPCAWYGHLSSFRSPVPLDIPAATASLKLQLRPRPHLQRSHNRHEGHRRCRLDGKSARRHSIAASTPHEAKVSKGCNWPSWSIRGRPGRRLIYLRSANIGPPATVGNMALIRSSAASMKPRLQDRGLRLTVCRAEVPGEVGRGIRVDFDA